MRTDKTKKIILDRIDNAVFMYDSYLSMREGGPDALSGRIKWCGILGELDQLADAFGFGDEAREYRISQQNYYREMRERIEKHHAEFQSGI